MADPHRFNWRVESSMEEVRPLAMDREQYSTGMCPSEVEGGTDTKCTLCYSFLSTFINPLPKLFFSK